MGSELGLGLGLGLTLTLTMQACSAMQEAGEGAAMSGVKEAAPSSSPAAAETFEPTA